MVLHHPAYIPRTEKKKPDLVLHREDRLGLEEEQEQKVAVLMAKAILNHFDIKVNDLFQEFRNFEETWYMRGDSTLDMKSCCEALFTVNG